MPGRTGNYDLAIPLGYSGTCNTECLCHFLRFDAFVADWENTYYYYFVSEFHFYVRYSPICSLNSLFNTTLRTTHGD